MEAKEYANKLTDRVADVKVEKVGGTLTDVKSASPVYTLVALFAEVDAKTVGKTLGDVEAEALVDRVSETLSEAVVKTIAVTLNLCESGGTSQNRK